MVGRLEINRSLRIRSNGVLNQILTVGLIPLALLTQVWGPLLGSLYEVPFRKRRLSFCVLLIVSVTMVLTVRMIYQPSCTQVTPQGHLNWWSPQNPPVFPIGAYAAWALLIGAPFLLWWRPVWQSLVIVSWGWFWAAVSYVLTDSAASYWCFFVSFYAAFVVIYAFMVKDSSTHDESLGSNLDL